MPQQLAQREGVAGQQRSAERQAAVLGQTQDADRHQGLGEAPARRPRRRIADGAQGAVPVDPRGQQAGRRQAMRGGERRLMRIAGGHSQPLSPSITSTSLAAMPGSDSAWPPSWMICSWLPGQALCSRCADNGGQIRS